MSNRHTYEFIKEYFEKEGYELLTKEYKNNKQKLEYICPKGHKGITDFTHFQQGRRCRKCRKDKISKIMSGEKHWNWKGGVSEKNILLYNTYAHQIDWCEEVRRDPENNDYLQVRCVYCNKWFNPTRDEIYGRMCATNSIDNGSQYLYCSEECKQKCCLYGKVKYPKGFVNKYNRYRAEVDILSNKNFNKYHKQINPKNLKRGKKYQLDHIYSVADGFNNNISVEIVSNPFNLRMLPSKINNSKNDKSDITKEELYKTYNQNFKQVKE